MTKQLKTSEVWRFLKKECVDYKFKESKKKIKRAKTRLRLGIRLGGLKRALSMKTGLMEPKTPEKLGGLAALKKGKSLTKLGLGKAEQQGELKQSKLAALQIAKERYEKEQAQASPQKPHSLKDLSTMSPEKPVSCGQLR